MDKLERLNKMAEALEVSVEELETPPWVVWSEEHGGWWRPGEMGYTDSLREAGRYSGERAMEIEKNANRYLPDGVVNEVALIDPLWATESANRGERGARRES